MRATLVYIVVEDSLLLMYSYRMPARFSKKKASVAALLHIHVEDGFMHNQNRVKKQNENETGTVQECCFAEDGHNRTIRKMDLSSL